LALYSAGSQQKVAAAYVVGTQTIQPFGKIDFRRPELNCW
jgi:hypothetical protein